MDAPNVRLPPNALAVLAEREIVPAGTFGIVEASFRRADNGYSRYDPADGGGPAGTCALVIGAAARGSGRTSYRGGGNHRNDRDLFRSAGADCRLSIGLNQEGRGRRTFPGRNHAKAKLSRNPVWLEASSSSDSAVIGLNGEAQPAAGESPARPGGGGQEGHHRSSNRLAGRGHYPDHRIMPAAEANAVDGAVSFDYLNSGCILTIPGGGCLLLRCSRLYENEQTDQKPGAHMDCL